MRAVRAIARLVARAIEPRAGHERIGHEALARLLRLVEISARERDAADAELAGGADGDGTAGSASRNVDLRVRDGPADRRKQRPAFGRPFEHVRGGDVRFRRAVLIVERAAVERREQPHERRRGDELLARRDHLAQRRRRAPLRVRRFGEMLQRHERREQPLDARGIEAREQQRRIAALVVCHQDERAAGAERREDFLERDVEADRRELQRPRAGGRA